jgi:hypothetical protein
MHREEGSNFKALIQNHFSGCLEDWQASHSQREIFTDSVLKETIKNCTDTKRTKA